MPGEVLLGAAAGLRLGDKESAPFVIVPGVSMTFYKMGSLPKIEVFATPFSRGHGDSRYYIGGHLEFAGCERELAPRNWRMAVLELIRLAP